MARVTLPEAQEALDAHQKSEIEFAALELIVSMLLSGGSIGIPVDQLLAGRAKTTGPEGTSWPL